MKFIASLAVAATTIAAFANAQAIAINDPNVGAVWKTGADNYVMWTGACKNLGVAAKNVTIQLMTGPAEAIRFKADLGVIDCSAETATNTMKKIPDDTESGTYSLLVKTNPPTYSQRFQVQGVAPVAAPQPSTAPVAAPVEQKPAPSGAGSLAAGSMVAAAGVAVAALQLIL